ncbi:hypothetical protein OUZ56_002470 [Daphnia magna]|uniref:Uncharacterized protein n=1 Tax=Daphnia magna TaxID=35525 RepID=A0ABR0A5U5_9CRUS|nr:hypothetical protein OUZ56_002470 [Daphnia magna]
MAQRSDDDNNVSERQANLDIENMVMLQQDQSSEKICGSISPMDLEVSPIYVESDFSQEPKNMKASFFFNDEMELQDIAENQVLSTPTQLIGFSPDVESTLMESEFPEAEFDEEFNIIDEDDNEDPDEEDLELCIIQMKLQEKNPQFFHKISFNVSVHEKKVKVQDVIARRQNPPLPPLIQLRYNMWHLTLVVVLASISVPHHISLADGTYNGRQVIVQKQEKDEEVA